MVSDEEIGKYIKELRETKRITQEELANSIHISRNGLSDIEHGKIKLSVDRALILSNIFGVTVLDIYNGGKYKKEVINQTIEKINNFSIKSIKSKYKIMITSITLICVALIIIFLSYYFFNSYNSVKVYKVEGASSNFKTNEGLLIASKEKIYFSISVEEIKDKKIKSISLYQNSGNDKKLVVKNSNRKSIYLADFYNYEEYFNYDDIVKDKMNLQLIIYYGEESEEINLNVIKDYENNKILFKNKENISEKNDKVKYHDPDIPEKILNNFTYNNDSYRYQEKMDYFNMTMTYFPDAGLFILKKDYLNYSKTWNYHIAYDSLFYKKYEGDEVSMEIIETKNGSELANEFFELYNEYVK